jgi:hypothetical protein
LPNHPKNLGSVVLERVQNESETWQNPPHKRLEMMGQCRTVADQQQLQQRNSRFCRIGSNCLTNWFMCIYICIYIYIDIQHISAYFKISQNQTENQLDGLLLRFSIRIPIISYSLYFPLFPSRWNLQFRGGALQFSSGPWARAKDAKMAAWWHSTSHTGHAGICRQFKL